ncbi:MAG: hypothetical protein NPINA01_22910 [Nitrospinaceae bacterium]|nr:MAG: hypothetical protein NPINA01_22910 [Nitrospinaceae bacterium]
MGSLQFMNSLSEQDCLAVQDINGHLLRCRTRSLLKALFESDILPLLNADSAIYAWTDPDLLSPKLIDAINIPEGDLALVNRFIDEDPKAPSLLTHTHPVIARDIDIPNGKASIGKDFFQEEPFLMDSFSQEKPASRDGYGYFSTSQTGMITLALRDSNLGAGIHRHLPCDKPWTVRDVRVVEQIRTPLLMAIKTIVLTEELTKQKSIVNILADSPTAIAVVDSEMNISYSNPAWSELMPKEAAWQLDSELKAILKNEKAKCQPPFVTGLSKNQDPVYKLAGKNYQLCFAPLRGDHLVDEDPWLLQVKPMRAMGLGKQLRQAGLTKREMEACELLRQGIDSNEIAERLFISPHTVKTHLKRIHQKLGVHTRAQLVAALNR